MTATINVNLKPCSAACREGLHHPGCPATPVLIPCPIPGSFTAEVRLGECTGCYNPDTEQHLETCPARPVKVSCSIGGDGTWAGSEVDDMNTRDAPSDSVRATEGLDVLQVCRARWEIVKALVTGLYPTCDNDVPEALVEQRNAVFAALADMARAEQAAYVAQNAALLAMGDRLLLEPYHKTLEADRPSAWMLERFVARLVEQVGVLP